MNYFFIYTFIMQFKVSKELFSNVCFKLLAVGNVPEKLPTMLNNLRSLELSEISFTVMDELSSALCLIRSSPNLQKLKFRVSYYPMSFIYFCLMFMKTGIILTEHLSAIFRLIEDQVLILNLCSNI